MSRCLRVVVLGVVVLSMSAVQAAAGEGVAVGSEAPGFSLSNESGERVSLEQHSGKIRVLEWINPDCPFVKRHHEAGTMKDLAERFADDVVWIGINSTHYMSSEDNAAFKKAHGLPYPVLDDHEGVVGRRYGAATTPHLFIIDAEGRIVYQGAIDDDPRGGKGEKATNHVALALEALTAGRPVATAQTKPYGCSVKYAR